MNRITADFLYIGSGIVLTLELLVGSVLIGLVGGVLFAVARRCNTVCKALINGIVSVVRGTPVILQLSIIYFTIPQVFGCKLGIIPTGVIAFGINSSAYVAEILRAGIENLPKGQFEVSRALGIPRFHMWKDIILPQVLMNILPALINETVTLLKETALIATVGGMDIMRRSQVIAAEQYEYFIPLCIAAFIYYALVLLIEFIGRKVEGLKRYAENL
ncbi:MAG: amino acid ABC transporter permease [Holosporales bacterium]|nr:amino acid ABC transporter permease [Holosporales bacterium]